MVRWLLFLHVTGVALWLGSTLAIVILNRKGLATEGQSARHLTFDTTRTVVRWVTNPSALVVLISGVGLIMGLGWLGNPKPLWISFMEQFGGMIALLSVVLISLSLRRAYKKPTEEERMKGFKKLSWLMTSVGTLVTATIFVVMFRLT